MLVVHREIGVTVTIHVNVIVITGIGTRRGDLHGWASKGNMYYQIYIVSDVLLSMLVELPEVMIDVMVVEIGGLGIILHRVVDEEEEISKRHLKCMTSGNLLYFDIYFQIQTSSTNALLPSPIPDYFGTCFQRTGIYWKVLFS